MKIKLKDFVTKMHPDDEIQDVYYRYSIEDSTGLLAIDINIPLESDPVEWFVYHTKDLYKDMHEYIVYHNKWKYILEQADDEIYIQKIKMYN